MLHRAPMLKLHTRRENVRLLGSDISCICPHEVSIDAMTSISQVNEDHNGLTPQCRNLQRNETFIENVKRAWALHVPNISLEQALSDLEKQDQHAPPQTANSSVASETNWDLHNDPGVTSDPDVGNAEYSNAEDYEFDESDDFNETIDGMGFLTVGPRKSGYTGPQSGIAAIRFLRSLPTEGHLEHEEPAVGVSPSDSVNSHEPALNAVNIDEMVNDFFTLFHPAYPLLHEGLFRARMAGMCNIAFGPSTFTHQ